MLVLRVLTPQGQKYKCTYTNPTIKSKKQARSNNFCKQTRTKQQQQQQQQNMKCQRIIIYKLKNK